MKNQITFDQLPRAVSKLLHRIDELEILIKEKGNPEAENPYLGIDEAAKLLMKSKHTIYGAVSRREIPHFKRGSRLYFSKKDLLEYLEAGRKKTVSELQSDAAKLLGKRGGAR